MSISEYVRREEERAALPRVVGFAANGRRAGKSFVASKLMEALQARGYKPVRLAMADAVRTVTLRLSERLGCPLSRAALFDDKDKPLCQPPWGDKTGRDLLIAVGETMVDTMGPEFWANVWLRTARGLLVTDSDRFVVCDDIRRMSELAAVRSLGGFVIYLRGQNVQTGEIEGAIDPSACDLAFDYDKTDRALANILQHVLARLD